MKKRIGNLILMAGLVSCLSLPVMAADADLYGQVSFTKDGKMSESDLNSQGLLGQIANMQPGDSKTIEMRVVNDYAKSTNWYLSNEVIQSLQEADAERSLGGGYGYKLSYEGPTGSTILYESKALGGSGFEGLHEMNIVDKDRQNDDIDKFVFLDTLNNNQSGVVSLEISLDGETQGNDYQEKIAEVALQFATEIADPGTVQEKDKVVHKTEKKRVVNTSTLTNRLPWLVLSAVSGLILLILAFFGLRERKKEGA